ncbi:MAG: DciA family protein [Burkholderiaceae bacterium]
MNSVFRSNIFSLEQAADAEPSLAALAQRVRASQQYLKTVQHLVPTPLRTHVKAGPLDDGVWCILVSNTAASTKIRQMIPSLLTTLNQNGAQITAIRIKVQTH